MLFDFKSRENTLCAQQVLYFAAENLEKRHQLKLCSTNQVESGGSGLFIQGKGR